MLKGHSAHIQAENARTLRQKGYSEAEAVSLSAKRSSLDAKIDRVREAVQKALKPADKKKGDCCGCGPIGNSPYPYVKETFETYCIVEMGKDLYKVPFTDNGKTITVGEKVKVEHRYVEVGK